MCVFQVALAQVLFGDISPTGRLPYTIYPEVWATNTQMTDMALTAGDGRTYKWYKGTDPAPFVFGEGITYTDFTMTLHKKSSNIYSVAVTNTGKVSAQQTVMVYARAVSVQTAPLPLPNRQLFDFGRTRTLAPGSSEQLEFQVNADAVALVDWDGTKKAYAGSYAIEFFTGGREAAAVAMYKIDATTTLSTLPPPPSMRNSN